ncbi:probable cytochrome P450 6g2 isoform X2 [Linepithema humile]|uniref:probable cytochrome P450 6g2 isoform X2 n=1 Tax=Linepithema humile TaxID=83485 RepID=UPI000623778A|nr:PREDICTED: probable cytochrome P450 6g2 isoform X2 [Linepithema humile]
MNLSIVDIFIYCSTALVICISLFYAYAKYKLSYWSRRGVKTPPTHLIFGNFGDSLTLKKPPSEVLREIYNYADPDDPYIGFYIFHKPMLLLRNHDVMKQIFIKDFDVFPNRRFGSANQRDALGLDSILSIQQPRWKYLRNKLTVALSGQRLKNMFPLIIECGQPMLNFMKNLSMSSSNKTEVKELSGRYVTDIIASVIFGINATSFDEKKDAFWKNSLNIFYGFMRSMIMIMIFFIPEWIPLFGPTIKIYTNYFRKIFWDSMNSREKSGYKRGDFIDFLLTLKNEEQDPIYKFEGDHLLAQSASLLIAGIEATADAIAFALYNLARHPELQATLYDEIQTHISGKELTMDLITEMSFLDSVLIETLRLHPPLPIVDRIATRNYKLLSTGLIIEKDIPVYISINATNQDPKYFSNPHDFIPLRAETGNKKFYESLAFGLGQRSCIGQRLGLLIAKVALITILSNYILDYEPSKKDDKGIIHVFTYAADGLYVQLKKREKGA